MKCKDYFPQCSAVDRPQSSPRKFLEERETTLPAVLREGEAASRVRINFEMMQFHNVLSINAMKVDYY